MLSTNQMPNKINVLGFCSSIIEITTITAGIITAYIILAGIFHLINFLG